MQTDDVKDIQARIREAQDVKMTNGPLLAVLEGRMAARIGHRPLLAFGGGGGAGRRQRRGIRSPQNGLRPAGHRRRADSVAVPAGEIPASSGSPCSQKAALHRRRMRAAKQPGLA